MNIRLIQYSYGGHATIYLADASGANAPGVLYAGPLLTAAVAALTPLIPADQTPQSLEIDPAGQVPSAYTTVDDVQTPSAFRQRLTLVITTDTANIAADSETIDPVIRDALLALWADVVAMVGS
jgi:hypothetical protein